MAQTQTPTRSHADCGRGDCAVPSERGRCPSQGCRACGGSCPPRADGFCQTYGMPATRNYDG